MAALLVSAVDEKPLRNYPRGVLAMCKLVILVLALVLLGAATAATADPAVMEDPTALPDAMTCHVFPDPQNPPTYDYCAGSVEHPGVMYAPAIFYATNFIEGTEVLWSRSACDQYQPSCSVSIPVNTSMTVTVIVLHSNGQWSEVSATADFYNEL